MWSSNSKLLPILLLGALPAGVLGADILQTTGFSTCISDPAIKVTKLNVQYSKSSGNLVFDLAGTSQGEQNVTAYMSVTAYGRSIYTKTFNPCAYGLTELCPVPAGTFASSGDLPIPSAYASEIPAIAFAVPDLDGDVKLSLKNSEGEEVGCVESTVGNGKTVNLPAVKYAAAGIAVAALALSAISAIAAGGHPGASSSSPTFSEVVGWFQGMAINGMYSVQYPSVYQSFTTNFGFSTGLISWGSMQDTIDSFRKVTGGNLTDDNYPWLKNKATLVYEDGDNSTASAVRRAADTVMLLARQGGVSVSENGTSTSFGSSSSSTNASSSSTKQSTLVSGIQAYVEELTIPQSNTFMTLLLIWAIVVAAIVVGILLIKVILEAWSLFGKLPRSLESWRKRYWWRMAKAITNLILLLYGMWTLYSIYQFTEGDSWAAKVLAGVTWSLFTLVLVGFTWRIYYKAQQFKKLEGDTSGLYEDKETWVKYSLFYDNFQKQYWLFFVPVIVYMFARGCIVAGANKHGLVQVGGELVIEALMLCLLLWTRPYQRKSGKWINIIIHVVRFLSVGCILIFVEELGISQTTKTITGVILIVVQSVLTVVLGILIAVNALITCIKENPHRKARKEAEKANFNRDLDNLTPLDARNSLLMEPMAQQDTAYKGGVIPSATFRDGVFGDGKGRYDPVGPRADSPAGMRYPSRFDEQKDRLVSSAASMGVGSARERSVSPPRQQPKLPDLDFGYVNRR